MPTVAHALRALLTAAGAAAAVSAHALPMTFSFSGIGSGSLGDESFSDSAFTLVATADSADIVIGANGRRVPDGSATVTLASGSSATFTGEIFTVVNVPLSSVGLSDFSTNRAILFIDHPAAAGIGLDASIGPLDGTAFRFNNGFGHGTTAGLFVINDVSAAAFTATAVPEPASAALMLAGGVALLAWRRRAGAATRFAA